jgi:protein-disulfide isomerase/uncharacterized membrane protein
MSKIRFLSLVLTNTIGILASLFSLIFSEKLTNYIFQPDLICDVSRIISCSDAYGSPYAFLFGIPIALYSLVFFWFIVSFLLLNRKGGTDNHHYTFPGLLNGLGLIACGYYLYISLFVLGNICIPCLIINLAVLINCLMLAKYIFNDLNRAGYTLKQFISGNKLAFLSLLLLIVTGLVLFKTYRYSNTRKNKIFLEAHFMQEPVKLPTGDNSIVWGNKNGKVELKIFNDFLCGYCKIACERYRKIVEKNFPDAKIEFIIYPLNYEKNNASGSDNMNVFLSRIMLAARHDKDFWHFHDAVIGQPFLPDSLAIMNLAKEYLKDYPGFKKEYFLSKNDSILSYNVKLATQLNISGTPAIYINGREFTEWTNIELMKMIIAEETHINP